MFLLGVAKRLEHSCDTSPQKSTQSLKTQKAQRDISAPRGKLAARQVFQLNCHALLLAAGVTLNVALKGALKPSLGGVAISRGISQESLGVRAIMSQKRLVARQYPKNLLRLFVRNNL